MFGRRRRRAGKHSDAADATGPADDTAEGPVGAGAPQEPATGSAGGPVGVGVPPDRPRGPWDETEPAPELPRVDLGALRVPVSQEFDVQLNLIHDEVVAATITYEGSALQLQAFAAPKSGGLWDEARQEIVRELTEGGRDPDEAEGPFGWELRAELPVQTERGEEPQPARFVGVDGPRWLLRGVFTGPAAAESARGRMLENVFRGTVVVRGEAPMPPRERLPLQVPPDVEDAASSDAPDGGRGGGGN